MKKIIALCLLIIISCSKEMDEPDSMKKDDLKASKSIKKDSEAISFSGNKLFSSEASEKILYRYNEIKKRYDETPNNIDNIIWYGRFTAYIGKYNEAISIYSNATEEFPNEARIYRHRGHRYLSIRKIDEAISDFEKAVKLIENTEDQIEEDGMPNEKNIPVSTLHTNIWYHLGLAYYLKGNFAMAEKAFLSGYILVKNDDMRVAFTHWIYMIYQRVGMKDDAMVMLGAIEENMNIVESFAYHKLCLFYKNIIKYEDLVNSEINSSLGSSAALQYGIGNWHYYMNEKDKAKKIFESIVNTDSWTAFGFIAAEADLIYNAEF